MCFYYMSNLPEVLQQRIGTDAMVLKRNTSGWTPIHEDLQSKMLYLKKTRYCFDKFMIFEKIHRLSTCIYFRKRKKYTWLRAMKYSYDLYYYQPVIHNRYCVMNDLFSTDSYGYFIDDYETIDIE